MQKYKIYIDTSKRKSRQNTATHLLMAMAALHRGNASSPAAAPNAALIKIKELYKPGFFNKYGTDLYITIVIVIAFIMATVYFVVDMQLKRIKLNWSTERCKPLIMPFAGIINATQDESKSEYASQNFSYCTSQFFRYVFEKIVSSIYYIMDVIVNIFKSMLEAVQAIRIFFDKLRERFLKIIIETMHGIMNFIIPFIRILVSMRDLMNKIEGIFLSIIYMCSSAYMALKSFIGSLLTLSIIIICVMIVLMIIMWVLVAVFWTAAPLLPFHPPLLSAAISFTLTFIAIIVPFCIVAAFAGMVFQVNTTVPKVKNKKATEEIKAAEADPESETTRTQGK